MTRGSGGTSGQPDGAAVPLLSLLGLDGLDPSVCQVEVVVDQQGVIRADVRSSEPSVVQDRPR